MALTSTSEKIYAGWWEAVLIRGQLRVWKLFDSQWCLFQHTVNRVHSVSVYIIWKNMLSPYSNECWKSSLLSIAVHVISWLRQNISEAIITQAESFCLRRSTTCQLNKCAQKLTCAIIKSLEGIYSVLELLCVTQVKMLGCIYKDEVVYLCFV